MSAEAASPEPAQRVGVVSAEPSARAVTTGRATTATVFGVLAVGMSAFDSIARNLALPDIIKAVHITVGEASNLFAAAFAVTFLGNQVIGPLMDRIGRKRAYQLTLLAAGVTSGLTAFVTNAWGYGVIAALAGCCLVVETPALVIVGEDSPRQARSLLMAIVQGAFSGGVLIVGVVGNVLLPGGHWRELFLIAFAPLALVVLGQFVLKEPVRAAEARRVKREGRAERLTFAVDVERARRSEWRQLFEPEVRRQTIVLCVGGFLINYAPVFILALSATYFELYDHLGIGPISLSVTLEGAGCLAGTLLLGLLSRWFRSRDLLITFVLAGAIVLGLFSLPAGAAQILVLMTLYGFLGQGALGVWMRYIVESYPTRMRGTASGFVMGFFFLSNTVAPIMFGDLIGARLYVLAAALSAVISFCGGIVMLAGKRHPVGAELEELAV
ncbi:MAG TPA: MFS transporter [Streptosporangiaceae bacterium]|nr:MFS transporter [Streptosporangiaceae bacterium]